MSKRGLAPPAGQLPSRSRLQRPAVPGRRSQRAVAELQINLVGRTRVGQAIYQQLLESIQEGRLGPGAQLPPTRELAQRLRVSRTTVALAYERLTGEGLLTGRTGAGTFVVPRERGDGAGADSQGSRLRPKDQWSEVSLPYVRRLYVDDAEFDFRMGIPDSSLFPLDVWRRLVATHYRPENLSRGYGDPAGHPALRAAIARHIWLARGIRTDPEWVTITSGTQQALDLITKVFVGAGDRVAVEDPGYPPAWLLFRAMGARVEPIRVDEEGLDVSLLPADTRLAYVSPSHQFPVGVTMSLSRRSALLEWAMEAGAVIVEDDYDSEFRFGDRPIEPLRAIDATHVVYVGSFSKTTLPELRTGFVIAPPNITSALRTAKFLSDWAGVWAIQGALADFIDQGWYARHIRRARKVYEMRHRAVAESITRHLDDNFRVVRATVGLHVCAIAEGLSASDIHFAAARTAEVRVDELARYSAGSPIPGLLLGYGAIPVERIDEGIRRLAGSFAAVRRAGLTRR